MSHTKDRLEKILLLKELQEILTINLAKPYYEDYFERNDNRFPKWYSLSPDMRDRLMEESRQIVNELYGLEECYYCWRWCKATKVNSRFESWSYSIAENGEKIKTIQEEWEIKNICRLCKKRESLDGWIKPIEVNAAAVAQL